MTVVACGQCGIPFQVGVNLAGRRVRCKRCGGVTTVPSDPAEYELTTFTPVPVSQENTEPTRPARKRKKSRPDLEPWLSLTVGIGIAVAATVIPLVGMVPNILKTVVHELGHSGMSWLTGSPAVPSFDLINGGGVARGLGQMPILVLIIYAIFAYLIFQIRTRSRLLIMCLIGVAFHALVTFTGLRDILVISMGHGFEIIVAGIFLDRCLSGEQILRAAERPLYAFLGAYFLISNFNLANKLRHDPQFRRDYEEDIRKGANNDLARLAHELLHVQIETIAIWYIVFCMLAPLVAACLYWRHNRLRH